MAPRCCQQRPIRRPATPEIRVLILGSSSLLMQEGLTESLAGRFFFLTGLLPFTEAEMEFLNNLRKLTEIAP
ncbi:MAG: hypothetical protein U1C55_07415 [Smithellaceae bacterium]|nr:hypothetical protein [Smithellaceae bacterium]